MFDTLRRRDVSKIVICVLNGHRFSFLFYLLTSDGSITLNEKFLFVTVCRFGRHSLDQMGSSVKVSHNFLFVCFSKLRELVEELKLRKKFIGTFGLAAHLICLTSSNNPTESYAI